MFTGLVESIGTIRSVARRSHGVTLAVECPGVAVEDLADGESISVDGVCVSVTSTSGGQFFADIVPETLARTTLGRARGGARVNLERALRVGDRLGGHLVQGHVDTVARVSQVRDSGAGHGLWVNMGPEIAPFVAEKGSITLNGVSLTVASLSRDTFEVALIPETLARTNLGDARSGTELNVEVDLVARYLGRLMQHERGTGSSVVETPPRPGSRKGDR